MRILYVGVSVGLMILMTACSHRVVEPTSPQVTRAAIDIIDGSAICAPGHLMPTTTNFFVLLGAGLLTGLSHCVGMCGPLVGAFTVRRRQARLDPSTGLVLFQMGRLTSYLALGVVLGSTGYLVASLIQEWQAMLALLLGSLMVVMALSLLGLLPLQHWLASMGLARVVGGWLRHWMGLNHPLAPFGLGVANGLLPCGPVYALAVVAAASGNPMRGALVMLLFGLGTLPAMLGIGFSSSLLSVPIRSQLYRLAAFLVMGVGLQLALRGLAQSGQISHAMLGSVMLW